MAMQRNVVAVVDDDAGMRKATAFLLAAFGYCTELFDSGRAFLDAAATSQARCLVVDIQLGDISGLDMGRQLAANGCKIPIIFMTALDDETTHTQAVALGCIAYLRKPFPANLLLDAIVRARDRFPAPDRYGRGSLATRLFRRRFSRVRPNENSNKSWRI
jgi:FixJ family two-component response regulator